MQNVQSGGARGLELKTAALEDLTGPRDHTLVDCRNDFTVIRDLTETCEIRRDLGRITNGRKSTLLAGSLGVYSVPFHRLTSMLQ